MWKFLPLLLLFTHLQAAPLPPELAESLKTFRAEGPRGWSFTQLTAAGNVSQRERFDASQPEFNRWSLVQKNGRTPTADELRTYAEGKSRRSAGFNAPRIQEQLDLNSATLLRTDPGRPQWQFRLKPGGADDKSARFMMMTVTFHEPTRSVERVEISNEKPFSPVLAVSIAENRTVMNYSLPTSDRPSLLQSVTLHLRGQAFWFKSLDEDMTIAFSDYEKAMKK